MDAARDALPPGIVGRPCYYNLDPDAVASRDWKSSEAELFERTGYLSFVPLSHRKVTGQGCNDDDDVVGIRIDSRRPTQRPILGEDGDDASLVQAQGSQHGGGICGDDTERGGDEDEHVSEDGDGAFAGMTGRQLRELRNILDVPESTTRRGKEVGAPSHSIHAVGLLLAHACVWWIIFCSFNTLH